MTKLRKQLVVIEQPAILPHQQVEEIALFNADGSVWAPSGGGGVAFNQLDVNAVGVEGALNNTWQTFPFTTAGDPDPIGDLFSWDAETGYVSVARDAIVSINFYVSVHSPEEESLLEAYWWHGDEDDTGPWYYYVYEA